MSRAVEARLKECLSGTPLIRRLSPATSSFLEERGEDAAVVALTGAKLAGLARLLATNAEAARYLSHRPALLERLSHASADALRARARELESTQPPSDRDLEGFLDWLRLTRRDETIFAACLDLGGSVSFEETSVFLSILAESCTRWALQRAETHVGTEPAPTISVLAMGKIAGRELTYYSDLDLIFLYPDDVEEVMQPSRIAQRLIHYLTAMTGAGVAYAVDSRLRPSGRQGMLVSTYGAFDRYQRERAATWEHLALMRSRAIAGDISRAQKILAHAREGALEQQARPWPEIAEMRQRVEHERGAKSNASVALKTGRGGLMDVEFLAAGGVLELGVQPTPPALPSISWMLSECMSGPALEQLCQGYQLLRRIEARTRWVSGRADETLKLDPDHVAAVAELVEPGLAGQELIDRLSEVRQSIRSSYEAVIAAGAIEELCR